MQGPEKADAGRVYMDFHFFRDGSRGDSVPGLFVPLHALRLPVTLLLGLAPLRH